jgi:hypothetical protein
VFVLALAFSAGDTNITGAAAASELAGWWSPGSRGSTMAAQPVTITIAALTRSKVVRITRYLEGAFENESRALDPVAAVSVDC